MQASFAPFDYHTSLFSLASPIPRPARVVGIHDGDTISCIIRIGSEQSIQSGQSGQSGQQENHPTFARFNVRLAGIDAPEMTSHNPVLKEAAINVRNRLIELVTGKKCTFETPGMAHTTRTDICKYLCQDVYMVSLICKDMDKYGRLLAEVYVCHENDEGILRNINAVLMNVGLVNTYDGGHKSEFSLLETKSKSQQPN